MTKEKKPEAVKKEVKEKKPKGAYTLEVSVNDVEYKGSGETMVDALAGFVASKDFPFSVKTRLLLKFSNGEKSGIQRYSAPMANRMFKILTSKPQSLEIVGRKMEQRMA